MLIDSEYAIEVSLSEIFVESQLNLHPSFRSFLETGQKQKSPIYLAFLNLTINTQEGFKIIEIIIDEKPTIENEIIALLKAKGWRSHLVGGMSLLFGAVSSQILDDLWGAIDRGSWVCPQLAVVAYLVDKDFLAKAKKRIEDWPEFYGRQFGERTAKIISSLMHLCERIHSSEIWFQEVIRRGDIQTLLEEDIDKGGDIAIGWLSKLEEKMQEYGKELQKPGFNPTIPAKNCSRITENEFE